MTRVKKLSVALTSVILLTVVCNIVYASNDAVLKSPLPSLNPLEGKASWRFVGPMRGGRVNGVAGHPTHKDTYFAGYTGGGVFRTQDGGISWHNVSDGYFNVGSVGAVAVSQSHPDTIYVGTGEHALRGDVSHGDGVYKSTDGGNTWEHIGLTDSRQIAKIQIHPTDPDVVYVAALGHFTGPNQERGVFKTTDGGQTWKRVLFTGEQIGAVDLQLNWTNPNVLYAAMWDVKRFPWGIQSGGPGSGIYKSIDGGESWQDLSKNPGLPQGNVERIAVALSQANPNRLWALMSSEQDRGLYRSDDAGSTWVKTNGHNKLLSRVYYFNKLQADPVDDSRVYVINYRLWRSDDAGVTFDNIPELHVDHHALWIDPNDNNRMINGTDGGAEITRNGGKSWSSLHNQPTGQFYTLTLDDDYPYNLYGAQQDWSTIKLPSQQRQQRMTMPYAHDFGVSEAGRVAIRAQESRYMYVSDHHWLLKYDTQTGTSQYAGPRDETNYGWGVADIKYRFNWTFPVLASKHGNQDLYVGSQYLHRSTDGGDSWETISPDLTRAAPHTMELTPLPGRDVSSNGDYWGPVTRDSNGDHWFATLYVVSESPLQEGLIWTGSDDGRVHVTTNKGKSWGNVTPKGLPDFAMITSISPSEFDPASAFVTASAYKVDNYQTLVYKTEDYGQHWSKVTDGLPVETIARVVRQDKVDEDIVFLGTEQGAYVSFSGGVTWQPFNLGLPVVPIYDMQVKGDDLVVATHGRGFWIFEHLGIARQLKTANLNANDVLLTPQSTVRKAGRWNSDWSKPNGISIFFNLTELSAERGDISLVIKDSAGIVINHITSEDMDVNAGLNLYRWNGLYPNAIKVPNVMTRGNQNISPKAPPGAYTIELHIGNDVKTTKVIYRSDPRSELDDADLHEQFQFLQKVVTQVSNINQIVIEIRELKRQLDPTIYSEKVNELSAIEQQIVQVKAVARKDLHAHPVMLNDKFYRLANFVARAEAAPTQTQWKMLAEFSEQALKLDTQYKQLRLTIKL